MFLKVKVSSKQWSRGIAVLVWMALVCFWSGQILGQRIKEAPSNIGLGLQTKTAQVVHRGNKCLRFINPYRSSSVDENDVVFDLFEGLTSYNRYRQAVGSMADHWESDLSKKIWTFYLRPEARWSNGTLVTAHDFVASWRVLCTRKNIGPDTQDSVKTLLTTGFPLVNGWECYQGKSTPDRLGVEAVDDRTLQIQFRTPQAEGPLLECLTSVLLLPIPPKCIALLKPIRGLRDLSLCLSNGPFQIDQFEPNHQVVLKKNLRYWDAENVQLEEVVYHACHDNAGLVRAWIDGTLDLIPLNTQGKREMRPYLRQQKWIPANLSFCFLMNFRDPHLAKSKVRLVLNMLMERHNWQRECFVLDSSSRVVYGVLETDQSPYKEVYADWIDLPRCDRVKRACLLLEEAGYTKADPLKLTITYDWPDKTFQESVVRDWNLPNLKVHLKQITPEAQSEILKSREYQVILTEVRGSTWSPITFFQKFVQQGDNDPGHYDPYYEDRLEQLQGARAPAECQQLMLKLDSMLLLDMPILPWVCGFKPWVVRKKVGGLPLYKGSHPTGSVYSKHLFIHQ